jgi:hypothetical protein
MPESQAMISPGIRQGSTSVLRSCPFQLKLEASGIPLKCGPERIFNAFDFQVVDREGAFRLRLKRASCKIDCEVVTVVMMAVIHSIIVI